MLEIKEINKNFNVGTVDEFTLFDNFSLNIKKGDFVSVVGSNGSGKTTLLNIICGNTPIEKGSIIFDGKNITGYPVFKRSRYIGRVFQDVRKSTCGSLTICENMALAENKGRRYGLSPIYSRKKIDCYKSLLEVCGMGLENKINMKVDSLSGGQRQALALILATMTDIKLLILDEHTAALDPKSAETVMQLTDKVITDTGITALMVTHNLRYAVEYGTRILMFDKGNTVLDLSGEEKQKTTVNDILGLFNSISIECGN